MSNFKHLRELLLKQDVFKCYKTILFRNFIKMKKYGRGFVWTEEQDKYLKENYENGNPDEFVKVLGRSKNAIMIRAKKFGLKRTKQATSKYFSNKIRLKKISKYYINENFFDTWSNDMAYVLGWFYSDGCISQRSDRNTDYKTATISISNKDHYILEKINVLMSSNYKIYRYNGNSSLVIRNQKICNKLFDLGVVYKKSLILEGIDIPDKHIPFFISGLIDGDGSIETGRHTRINIYSGSIKFTYRIQKLLHIIGINSKVYTAGKIYTVRISKQSEIFKLYNISYKNNTYGLKRKRDLVEKIVGIYIERVREKLVATHIKTGEILKFKSAREAHNKGFCKSSIFKVLNKNQKHHKGYTWRYA